MSVEEDDELFVAVLRADLPTEHQQDLMRKRLFAAGLSVSTGLATMSATSVAHGGLAGAGAAGAASTASVLSKIGALSWPAKVVLAAALAAPVVSLPLWIATPSAPSTVGTPARTALPPPSQKIEAMPKQAAAPALEAVEPNAPSELSEPAVASPAPLPGRAEPGPVAAAAVTTPAVTTPSIATAPSAAGSAAFAPVEAPVVSLAQQRATTLAVETALLDRAFAELGAGHRAAAASLIAEHARRFPQGLLRQERERAQARLSAEIARDSKGE